MHEGDDWFHLASKLDWEYSYVSPEEVFPSEISGSPWLKHEDWQHWEIPFRTTYAEYVTNQNLKENSVRAVQEAVGKVEDYQQLAKPWSSSLKLHSAALPLAEFAAVIGNLRMSRFGRDSAWRMNALFGALDELRHTQIPLLLMHELLPYDAQFDWTHKFYHTNNWVSLMARHFMDELLLVSNPIEFSIATNFVFETGFTNLQFIGLSTLGQLVGDHMFEKMVQSIQTDEARHAQMGYPVLATLVKHDPKYAQYLLDKWFWRSWHLFAVVTGFSIDYFTPLEKRQFSFKEFMEEWILDQYINTLKEFGMEKPWYWDQFLDSLEIYHHMVYATAYTHRTTCWFDLVVPSPKERKWLEKKYPKYWDQIAKVWDRIDERWKECDPGNDWGVHGATPVAFCDLCQSVLCAGTPELNLAQVHQYQNQNYIFCSDPCAWIFQQEPERYADHKGIVKRILLGEAPSNLIELVRLYFDLPPTLWGKDMFKGNYPWLKRGPKNSKISKVPKI